MNYIVDTHILVCRFLKPQKLSKKLKDIFSKEENHFGIPTMALMEIQYLKEIKRIQIEMEDLLLVLKEHPQFELLPFDETVLAHTFHLTSNRDPFDRIILAHALVHSTKILTNDQWMEEMAPHLVLS